MAFNNAGIEGDVRPLVEQTEANYDAVMDINVKGVWLSMKYEIPRMLERGGGAIVNCASVAGLIGFPEMGIYIASKHAVIGLTKTAALEYSAQGIRINAVNPAVIDTEMVDRLAAGIGTSKEDLAPLHHRAYRSGRGGGRRRSVAVFRQGIFCDGAQSNCRRRIHRPLTPPGACTACEWFLAATFLPFSRVRARHGDESVRWADRTGIQIDKAVILRG